ncbi:hypothetical protein N9M15_04065 [Bacteroidia bacterium]|nr:hypothetical protein [Bacteroidia bacterium]
MTNPISPDGIHLTVPHRYHKQILKNFNFFQSINTDTGEIRVSKYGNEIWTANESHVRLQYVKSQFGTSHLHIRTSIGIFYKGNNYESLTRSDFQNAIRKLSGFIGVPMLDFQLRSFEFGYNSKLKSITTETFINSIIACKTKVPDRNSFNGGGLQLIFPYQHFSVKVYDKGQQMRLPYELLRMELVIHRMRYSQKHLGVINLNQMQLPTSQIKMEQLLRKKINDLIIVDPALITLPEYIPNQKEKIMRYSSSSFWLSLDWAQRKKQLQTLASLNSKLNVNLKDQLLAPLNNVQHNQNFLTRI